MNWQKLDLLAARFAANCDALARRDPDLADRLRAFAPAADYLLAAHGDTLTLARARNGQIEPLPQRIPPAGAQQITAKLYPTGQCTAGLLVAGIDQGWLWHFAYELPTSSPATPGFRPPLFFLARAIEELWVATHVHDWRNLLADPRVHLFVGADACDQLRDALIAHPGTPIPRLSVTLDATLWSAGRNLDALTHEVMTTLTARMRDAGERTTRTYATATPQTIAARLRGGAKLRVLGVTTTFSTFLKHSMRDWLAAFAADGHDTRVVVEQADHEQLNSLVVAEACAEFRPDLVLLIDHYRAELGGIPDNVPAVMWVQDYLPNLFNPNAGAAQKPLDYAIGYGRTECARKFNYPYERFMPAMVGVNDARFAPADLTDDDRRRFECDVCFVSHASRPADDIIREQIAENPAAAPLLRDAYDRLVAIYDQGHFLSHPLHVRGVIEEACVQTRMQPDAGSMQRITDLFTQRLNNALFRHQTLAWAADTGADLRIYGNGWEKHPRFARHARGPADNAADLAKIYRAARIHLQATPHGAVHQRLLEGLCSGGFFLIRYLPGDLLERLYQPLWDWCTREDVRTDEELMRRATPDVLKMLGEIQRRIGVDPFKLNMSLVDDMQHGHDLGWVRSAGTVWPDQYDTVAFDSAHLLKDRITHFLAHPDQRQATAAAMRQQVLDRLTYRAVNHRMLDFIADELTSRTRPQEAAA